MLIRKKTKTYLDVVKVLTDNHKSKMSGVSPRDSDTELIIQMIQLIHDAGLSQEQLEIIRSLNFESITRCRRKLQELGEFLPSQEAAKARRLKGYEIEQSAPKEKASGLQARIEQN